MIQKNKIMIYGANGYSAKLILEELMSKGFYPVLAGRSKILVGNLALEKACESRIFDLSDIKLIQENLNDVRVLLNCAGPFIETAFQLIEACIDSGTSYLDISGEIEVFKFAWNYCGKAVEKGVVVLPGAGFDVIPTDCLAKKLKDEMPDAVKLELGFAPKFSKPSYGTFKSIITHLKNDIIIRRNGKLESVRISSITKVIDFGDFKSTAMAVQFADVYNAYFSTSIDNIEAYTAIPKILIFIVKYFIGFLTSRWVKSFLFKFADMFIKGPDKLERDRSLSYIWGLAKNRAGKMIEHVFVFPDGYSLTAICAAECTFRIYHGEVKPGTQTPSLAFGSSFAEQFALRQIK